MMVDFDKIKKVYKLGKSLTLADIQVLIKATKSKTYGTGEFIIKEGESKKEVFFIQKGLVRVYKVNEKGNEITTLIRWENHMVASADVIFFNQPSGLFFQALEPTQLIYIDYDMLQQIISDNPKLEANRKYILQNVLKEALQRVDSFVLCSPEERYLNFIKGNPDIINRVPDKYIANVLGITPVSLSRIRKRIMSKK